MTKKQQELIKKRKMKRYLEQKQKQVNSSLGGALRKSSMLYYSRESDKNVAVEQQFGIYSTKEIMSVVRLFWSLDYDMSGSVECDELVGSDMFSCMGFGDPSSLFQTLDLDGSGDVSLDELLTVCFPYANEREIQQMVQLGKVGRIRHDIGEEQELTKAQLEELREIFKIFDKDNSGGVSADEIVEVLAGHDCATGYGYSVEEIVKFCSEYDIDGNDELDEEEFIALMKALYGGVK